MKYNLIGKVVFSLLAIIIIVLATTTVAEHWYGHQVMVQQVYHTFWFMLLWVLFAFFAFILIINKKLFRPLSLFLLHLSLLVIMTGALLTAFTAKHETVHLRLHEPVHVYGLTIVLDDFHIDRYPATNTPADYRSCFTITDNKRVVRDYVSMNKNCSYRGIRLCQSGYDKDEQGSTLLIHDDRWGIPVMYAGCIFFFVMLLWRFFSPKGKLQQLFANPLIKKMPLLVLFLLAWITTKSEVSTIPKEDAAKLAELQMLYNRRIAPLQTFAYDFTKKITGQINYKNLTPEQVIAGWLFYPDEWKKEPMIYVKNDDLRRHFGLKKWASFSDFFDASNNYIFEKYRFPWGKELPSSIRKAVAEMDEKVGLITTLQGGNLLKTFPFETEGTVVWYSSNSVLPPTMNDRQQLFVRRMFDLLHDYALQSDSRQFCTSVDRWITYQRQVCGKAALSPQKIKMERLYNSFPYVTTLYRFNLVAGLVALFLICFSWLQNKSFPKKRLFRLFFTVALFVSFGILSFFLVLRAYVSGRIPMSNGFETMLFLAWSVLLIAMIFNSRFSLMLPFGFLLSGFFLLVASFSMMNPQITPLVPVLSSPLLSLHVSLIMIAYALFSFTFINAVAALIFYAKGKYMQVQVDRLQLISQIFLFPAVFLLGAGIFIGAVWADISWGRYWGWDPKEVWALITFMVYAVALHHDTVGFIRKPFSFHLYMIFAFLCIIMTYFGVNYFLGGMHGYV